MGDPESDLQRRFDEVERREQAVTKRERAANAKSLKYNLYDRMDLSLGMVNAVIVACILALAVLIALGLYLGPGR